jgi:hypothetical protein
MSESCILLLEGRSPSRTLTPGWVVECLLAHQPVIGASIGEGWHRRRFEHVVAVDGPAHHHAGLEHGALVGISYRLLAGSGFGPQRLDLCRR